MKKERILLLGGNFFPETTGIGKYNGEMMNWLSEHGYECAVVTTYPYYPFWRIQAPHINKSFWYKKEHKYTVNGGNIKLYRCTHYVPKNPGGLKRILSDFSFFVSAFFQLIILLFQKKYDYVITVAPPFQIGLLGIFYQKIKVAKFIYHIQDLQIDAARELGMIKLKLLINMMFSQERFILRKADFVSSISAGMISRIRAKYNRDIMLFPNWVDTKSFHPILQKEQLRTSFNFSPNDKVILYSGAIGEKQGLQTLLQSAKDLDAYPNVKFVICGSGPYKQRLIELVEKIGLSNVIFMPLQPKEKFNEFLNLADVHLVLQKAHVNDLVMPSKLATILAVGGLALVTAAPETSLYAIIADNKMGILLEPENQTALTAAVKTAISEPHTTLKENARKFAENHLTNDKVVSRYFTQIIDSGKRQSVSKELQREQHNKLTI